MQAGKVPPELLAKLLARLPADPRVLLGPGIGHDAAAIDLGDGRVLLAKTDPVTFATEQIGRYVVHVNANDIACLGGHPTYFLATVLLPEGSAPALAEELFEQLRAACAEVGAIPVGGHTEITLGLERPIIAGMMLGETTREGLIRPDGARAGDHVVLTKGIAIEGTALLARDAAEALRARGVSEDVIDAAARLLDSPGISVVQDAVVACGAATVHALHDPTEGGLATALRELGAAAGLEVRFRAEDVRVLPETMTICDAVRLDPLGLLASGALLIAVDEGECDSLRHALTAERIDSACIGELATPGQGAIIGSWSQQPLPCFERDELARFFEGLAEPPLGGYRKVRAGP